LKNRIKGIKFRTWFYFLLFSVTMLALLGFLLIALLKPYYRENRLETINSISQTIEDKLINNRATEEDVKYASRLVVGNNVCAVVYNVNGREVYSSDSLGELCMLDKDITIDNQELNVKENKKEVIDILNENKEFNVTLNNEYSNTEMLLYGKKIVSNLANYYLVINSPLEPVESYINFILNQYLYVAVIVIIVALIVAYFFAHRISSPIIKMKTEANKLAEGNYDANFKTNSFSEINDLASTLDNATNKLSKIDELRKDLLANVSHDIKTPLTMIQAYAEMIKDISGDDPIKRNEHLDVILKETDYLNRLVSDMQEYSKMQAGYITLNKNNFDLKEAIEDVLDLLSHLIEEKGIILETDLKPVVIYGDDLKMSQVVYNFISNAIKHTDNNKKIIVKLIDSEEKVRFEVIDEGDGISEEALPYIWDRYYKIDKNYNRSVNSTGLGLAIAKAILEAHHATYGATSKLKMGSTFYFELSKEYETDEEKE